MTENSIKSNPRSLPRRVSFQPNFIGAALAHSFLRVGCRTRRCYVEHQRVYEVFNYCELADINFNVPLENNAKKTKLKVHG
jgi:hypothetical protein